MVYNFGNWEYSYIFRDAPESADYSCKKYGAFFLQLQDHLQQVMDGKSTMKFMYNVRHGLALFFRKQRLTNYCLDCS